MSKKSPFRTELTTKVLISQFERVHLMTRLAYVSLNIVSPPVYIHYNVPVGNVDIKNFNINE